VIRPAVESALAVARSGLTADPVVPPPPALRPFLGFAKQTPQSLRAIARVVEGDEDFRARVAGEVDEAKVGRAGWLWLSRPEGWADELEALESASAARTADEQEARAERAASRRLAVVEAAARRSESEAEAQRVELEATRADLETERALRARAEARLVELESQVANLAAARADAIRNLKRVEARLVDRSTEVNTLRARNRALEAGAAERDSDRSSPAAAEGPAPRPPEAATPRPRPAAPAGEARPAPEAAAPRPRPAAPAGEARPAPEPAAPRPRPAAPAGEARAAPEPERAAIATELARAAEGAAAVANGLSALARLLDSAPAATGPAPDLAPAPGPVAEPGPLPARRVPIVLPGGVFDDSPEAAEHLLRTPGVTLIVDGYNVTMTGWPELAAGEQRRRLVTALQGLAARTATRSEVVFDGAAVDPSLVPTAGRQLVRVRFSSPGVEADDVVLDLVERLPAATPLVVASSDKRVREGAKRLGANLLHARQLLDLLRR
jgi:predicted RNA-binding protein with PIN domain